MILLVGSYKGGAGKSGIAVSLSVALCNLLTKSRVLLADLDAEQRLGFDWLGDQLEHVTDAIKICCRFLYQRDVDVDDTAGLTCVRSHGQEGLPARFDIP